jgi:hypothetical protein
MDTPDPLVISNLLGMVSIGSPLEYQSETNYIITPSPETLKARKVRKRKNKISKKSRKRNRSKK